MCARPGRSPCCGRPRPAVGSRSTPDLPTYTGTAVHDRYALYFQYRCAHALCNAHLIRNLAGVGMVHSQKPWTDAVIDLLTDTNNQVNTARAAGKTRLSTHHQRQITRR